MPYYEIITQTETREHREIKWLPNFGAAVTPAESMPGELIKVSKITAIISGTIVHSVDGKIYGDNALDCQQIELGTWKFAEGTWDVEDDYEINFRFVD